jgi:CRP-like cAMP-binding protein
VIAAGTVADAVYVISAGSLRVTWAPEGEVVAEMTLGPGEVIGVASLARQQASHTHIDCAGDATLIRIPNDVVDDCLQKDARLAHEFARLNDVRTQSLAQARDAYMASQNQAEYDELLPVDMRRPQDEPGEGEAEQ